MVSTEIFKKLNKIYYKCTICWCMEPGLPNKGVRKNGFKNFQFIYFLRPCLLRIEKQNSSKFSKC